MTSRIVHFEIPFDDSERATTFYRDVFGWQMQPMPEMEYTMALTGPVGEDGMPNEPGYINGGMFQRTDSLKVPILTIGVDSIDATLDTIEKNGGKTVEAKTAIGDMGFAAYVNDPEGNLIGLWENAS